MGDLGGYRPLPAADNVVAFERGAGLVTAVPRLMGKDDALEVPSGRWHNLFTGEDVDGGPTTLTTLTTRFPVVLLERAS